MIDNGFSKHAVNSDGFEPLDHRTSLSVHQSQSIIISNFVVKSLVTCESLQIYSLLLCKEPIFLASRLTLYSKTFVEQMSRMEV